MLRWSMAFAASAAVVLLATLPPFVPEPLRAAIMDAFAPVCHQLPDRSPHIDGIALAVCHRCYGIYLGLPLAALAFLGLRGVSIPSQALRFALFGALALVSVDWGAPLAGLWHNTTETRMVTGLVFGLVAGWYLVTALAGRTAGVEEDVEDT